MEWLELTIDTLPGGIDAVAAALTAGGFADLVLEDQQEFETFLDQNRAYWDYIDEELQQKLQGLSHIKLYLEAEDEAGLAKLKTLLQNLKERPDAPKYGTLNLTVAPLAETNWEDNIDKYADLLDTLKDILDAAAREYDGLVSNHIEKTQL